MSGEERRVDISAKKRPIWLGDVWSEETWTAREAGHLEALEARLAAYIRKRAAQHKDPVLDFLFEYYRCRPAQLLRWTPGFGILLCGDEALRWLEKPGFVAGGGGVYLDPTSLRPKRRNSVAWIATLLENTAARPPSFGCYGMHEWAMVYRAEDVRHQQFPLRMSADDLAAFVEERPLRCTHFDAWRFFTPSAKPMNHTPLTRDDQTEWEQPGCLHANMDLYKWAYKLHPWVGSELVLASFELAVEARTIDMQASPYDLAAEGLTPIAIESAEGRVQYQAAQRVLWEKAAPIRAALLAVCRRILAALEEEQETLPAT